MVNTSFQIPGNLIAVVVGNSDEDYCRQENLFCH